MYYKYLLRYIKDICSRFIYREERRVFNFDWQLIDLICFSRLQRLLELIRNCKESCNMVYYEILYASKDHLMLYVLKFYF
jgi:prephenate dehydrogenase